MCPVQVRVNLWYTDGDHSLCNKPIVRSGGIVGLVKEKMLNTRAGTDTRLSG